MAWRPFYFSGAWRPFHQINSKRQTNTHPHTPAGIWPNIVFSLKNWKVYINVKYFTELVGLLDQEDILEIQIIPTQGFICARAKPL